MCGCRLLDVEREEESNQFVFYFTDTKKTNDTIRAYFGNVIVDKNEEQSITNNTNGKSLIIYDQQLAGHLLIHGYRLIEIEEDVKNKNRGKDIYYFIRSEDIGKEIQSYNHINNTDWLPTYTERLHDIIDSGMVEIIRVKIFNSYYGEDDPVLVDDFIYSLETLCNAEIFSECIEWKCNFEPQNISPECDLYVEGKMDYWNKVQIYLAFSDGITKDKILEKLDISEDEED